MTTPASPAEGQSPIRLLRKMRGSASVNADLYTSTADPLVLAFQLSVMFHGLNDQPLTPDALQQRWVASRRTTAAARRTLIALGYWAEVRVRGSRGRFRTETRAWETRLTAEDLADLASEYPPASLITCAGETYLVTQEGTLTAHRATKTGNSVRPAGQLTGLPKLVTRSDQQVPETGLPEVVTRSDQAQPDVVAGGTGLPEVVVQKHASLLRSDEETTSCMHDDFWELINTGVARIDRPGQVAVRPQLAVAFTAGWEPASLVEWVRAQVSSAKGRVTNPAGFVIAQLRGIPAVPAPVSIPAPPPPPACDTCLRDYPGARVNVTLRYRTDPDTGQRAICHCHPDYPGHTEQRETA